MMPQETRYSKKKDSWQGVPGFYSVDRKRRAERWLAARIILRQGARGEG
jgi:hypothetical protein